jgi:hypothetical protein
MLDLWFHCEKVLRILGIVKSFFNIISGKLANGIPRIPEGKQKKFCTAFAYAAQDQHSLIAFGLPVILYAGYFQEIKVLVSFRFGCFTLPDSRGSLSELLLY